MAHILVHHKVNDFNNWKPFFEKHSAYRAENGSLGGKVFRNSNDPNEVFVLLEWDSIENAMRFAQSDDTREVMKTAGVLGIPSVYFVEEVAETTR